MINSVNVSTKQLKLTPIRKRKLTEINMVASTMIAVNQDNVSLECVENKLKMRIF